MKKLIPLFLAAVLALSVLAGCAPKNETPAASGTDVPTPEVELQKLVVGASPTPHGEILAIVKELMLKDGYDLQIAEYTDYVQPNLALDAGDLDANFFQHQPYLDDFNTENKMELATLTAVHYEPLGIYPGKTASLEELPDGATIAVPNDTTNEARALILLQENGLIKLRADAGFKATVIDIEDNPKNLKIIEIEAAQLARSLQDVDVAVINGNYALAAGLDVEKDALAREEKDSVSATTYANIVAIRPGDENRADLKALAAALKSEEVKNFIAEKYEGAVVAMF